MHNLLDATWWLSSFGTVGIAVVLFAGTGLLVGLFLPGDSLLFTAGLFAAAGTAAPVRLSLPAVLIAAAAGPGCGPRSTVPARSSTGTGRAIVLARFVPLVRTVLTRWPGSSECPTPRSPGGRC